MNFLSIYLPILEVLEFLVILIYPILKELQGTVKYIFLFIDVREYKVP